MDLHSAVAVFHEAELLELFVKKLTRERVVPAVSEVTSLVLIGLT